MSSVPDSAVNLAEPKPAPAEPEAASDQLLGIRAVCEAMGLSARTVRYWEELGLLPGVRRRQAGRRVYGLDEVERMRFIQRLKTLGLSLAEIKDLNAVYAIGGSTADMLRHLEALLGKHLAGLDERIAQLVTLRDEMKRYRNHVIERALDREPKAPGPSQEISK